MTLDQFRISHSLLIEHYQFIEMHMEGIYASLCSCGFQDGLKDVERANLYKLFREIEEIERETGSFVFSDEDREIMKRIIQRRNYWVHNCYVDIVFDRKTGNIKKLSDIELLRTDVSEAESVRQRLFNIKMKLMKL